MHGRHHHRLTALSSSAAAALVCSAVMAPPAAADRTFRTTSYDLTPVAGSPLRSGQVIDVHAEGRRVYAQERYHVVGALRGAEYTVVLSIFADTGCDAKSLVVALPTDTFTTNRAGNGHGSATFRPADAAGLAAAQDTYGLVWNVLTKGEVAYTTGCREVAVD